MTSASEISIVSSYIFKVKLQDKMISKKNMMIKEKEKNLEFFHITHLPYHIDPTELT
ncbi:MAG: hypothetical protein U9O65_06415 [Thermotogota bacterium]|nr:hypothetical protein [Thermotogota bacterium]